MAKMIISLALVGFFAVLTQCCDDYCICSKFQLCDIFRYKNYLEKCWNITVRIEDIKTDSCYNIWLENCERCTNSSCNRSENAIRFEVGLNKFALMRDDEFLETMLNNHIYLAENWRECRTDVPPIEGEIPDSVNWAATGAVTSVKDQNNCISSWAFSAIGVMEAYNVLQFNRTLTTLSAQNLIDCSQYLGNYGCYGGDIISAFKYVRENGIDTDSTYPYVAKEPNECVHKKNNSIGNLAQDFRCLIEGDEDQLKAVVSKFGPVAVSVDARRWDFRFYKSGIYYSDECCNYNHCLNHAMLVVGYGTQDETDYWLLKNTWGESWGENGYMKIARNRNNTCGVATAGIFQLENCITSFKGLDHAMLIVGYGNEEGKDFWLVKNSWGKEWGLDGYIKVARNADNNCEIATLAIYPVATVIVDRICHFFQLFVTN